MRWEQFNENRAGEHSPEANGNGHERCRIFHLPEETLDCSSFSQQQSWRVRFH